MGSVSHSPHGTSCEFMDGFTPRRNGQKALAAKLKSSSATKRKCKMSLVSLKHALYGDAFGDYHFLLAVLERHVVDEITVAVLSMRILRSKCPELNRYIKCNLI